VVAKTWIGWGLVMAGAIAAGPLVLGRGNPALEPAHAEIAHMSEVERNALARKYDQYRALTEEQRTSLRSLHQQLEADRASGARYLSTMNDYCDWLKTIDPWQQNELAHIDDPLQKAKRVDEIARERHAKSLANAAANDDESPPGMGFGQAAIILTEEQLNKVFDSLAQRLPPEVQQEYEKEHGLRRIGLQIRALKQKVSKLDVLFRSLPESELQEMVEASGNTDLLAVLTNTGDMPRLERHFIVKRSLWVSVVAQFRREATAITDAELQTVFNRLTKEEQDDLMQLRAEEFKNAMRLRCLAADPVIAELRFLGPQFDIQVLIERMEGHQGFRGPNGPGGLNGSGPRPRNPNGERPPLDGRREGGPLDRRNGPRGSDGPPPRPRDGQEPPPPRPEGAGQP
jgi:hypothetical protein